MKEKATSTVQEIQKKKKKKQRPVKKKKKKNGKRQRAQKKGGLDELHVQMHCTRHFYPLSSLIFSLQFFIHFGEKIFWCVRKENTWVPQFIFLSPYPTKHT